MSTEGPSPLPSQFGRYTLLERLAVGGMAEVFRAKIVSSHGFEKVIVIKRILPNLAADKTFVSMFIDEAKLTAQLTHPKIVQILDFGDVSGNYFIALEFIDGFDGLGLLRTCAQKHVRLPLHIAVFIIMEVLEALDYAHNARDMGGRPMQIVHRDISPSNVFLSRRGDVKLGDFGIAHAQERESKTQAGTLKGKYGYMSPEQVTGGGLDGRSDLFAVGIVLAEMLMGRRLYTAAADLDVLLMVRDARTERFDKYSGDLPPKLDRIVRRALKKDPAERHQSASQFRETLADYLFESGRRVSSADLRSFLNELFEAAPASAASAAGSGRVPRAAKPTPPAPLTTARRPPAAAASPARPPPPPADAVRAPVRPPAPAEATALGNALAQPLSVVDIDQWSSDADRVSGPGVGWNPAAGETPADGSARVTSAGPRRPRATSSRSEIGRFVSGAPTHPPDQAGNVGVISPMRIFADLAVAKETGLLRFEIGGQAKEIYLVNGTPQSVNSSFPGERFGEYLVGKGLLGAADLERALTMLPSYAGKLGDTLVALGLMKPLDVFRWLSQQVRDRVLDVFAWTQGSFAFYRGVINEQESFPLGLDTFEMLGAGVLNLPSQTLEGVFSTRLDFRPSATGRSHVSPDAFRLGPTPGEVLRLLDGERTLRAWMAHFTTPGELLTFLRSLYLLVETDQAKFE
ncbi:MAG TPA: protein kinase [Polyangia bacterium]|jgi:serine/threonine-protein kinase|nr:protein kinase [Polyangia bacterium]